ncbi:ATP-binding protein [Nonomuraea sp. LPB2021202275-12-8]|uniref:ATP-binding protein n=1 Tax=Nonomuraea sp. LPB2021202275-12-8 TaxID=3120159 RepID=UPI00300D6D25
MADAAASFLHAKIESQPSGTADQNRQLLRKLFAHHGGRELASGPGELLISFAGVANAIMAAVRARRSTAVSGSLRIGVHVGEAGPAAEISLLASAGQILVSQTAKDLLDQNKLSEISRLESRRRGPPQFPVYEVIAAPEISDQGKMPLPLSLRSTTPFSFVGRVSELAILESLLPLAEETSRRVALIRGEAGSGKTRLVREFAHAAVSRGVRVLYGACDAVVNAPYQPFAEALEFLVGILDSEMLSDCLAGNGELSRLLPDLSPRPTVAAADPDTERYRLHVAVADLLEQVSRHLPVLLVVDDAHWADTPSLHLIRHLIRASPGGRLLLVIAFRPGEADILPEFAEALADIQRAEGVTHLPLRSLNEDEVQDFVRHSARVGPDVDVLTTAHEIGELTGGNPFLLGELWRTLAETGNIEVTARQVRLTRSTARLSSPDSVRDVVRQRLQRLSPEAVALLEMAAVIGPEFDLKVLADAARMGNGSLMSSLDEAVRSGMLQEGAESSVRLVYRFAHELVRRALYDRLTGTRRAELHLRAGEALERANSSRLERVLPELAYHFSLGAAMAGPERAVEYNVRSAEAAMDSFAFEDAAAQLKTALRLGVGDEHRRAHIQLDLALACHRAGQSPQALAAYGEAAAHARVHGDAEMLAQVAIGFEEASWRPARAHEQATMLLNEAVSGLEDDSPLQARALSHLTRALVFTGQLDKALETREKAVAMARRTGDRQALGRALAQAYYARGPIPYPDVIAMLRQARELGNELGDAELVADSTGWLAVTLVELCDLDAASGEIEGLRRAAEQTHQAFPLYTAYQNGSALALCAGRLADAETMAEQSWYWSRRLHGRSRSAEYGLQMFSIQREQGRLTELRPIIELLAGEDKAAVSWRPGLVALLADLGLKKAAQAELNRLLADGVTSIPQDGLRVASLSYLADACSILQDARCAALTYPALLPLAGGNVRIGQLTACYGAADRYLGMLAATMKEWDKAEAHFELALELNTRMGAHTWTAHTAYQYGRMLRSRGSLPDRQRATQLLADATRLAERHALRALACKISALEELPSAPDGLSNREVEVLRLVAQGRSNREIGLQLHISEHTAANHIRSILHKSGSANRTDAASYAHRHGLIQD